MVGPTVIALAAAIGVAIWVYSKTAYRGMGDFKRQAAPAVIAGILAFFIALTLLWAFLPD